MSDAHAQHDSDELDPDEPHTPWWMPLLGGSLFLVAALAAVVMSGDPDAPAEGDQAETAQGLVPGGAAAPQGQQGHGQQGHDHAGDHAGHDHD